MAIRKIQIYLFAFSFLIVTVIITIGLYYLGNAFPRQEYYNPMGLIVGLGPLLTAVIFILVNRNDKFRDVALRKFNMQPLIKIVIILVFVYLLEYLLYSIFGFVEFRFLPIKWQFYNTEFGYFVYFFLAFSIPFVYTGIGEEFGWRGYLFHKLNGLKWGELV
jgi:membrane protease YdiL (CAAX protease family)